MITVMGFTVWQKGRKSVLESGQMAIKMLHFLERNANAQMKVLKIR
jgi:hypothetical protein